MKLSLQLYSYQLYKTIIERTVVTFRPVLSIKNFTVYSSIQLTIDWDEEQMIITPPLHQYNCNFSAKSPAPSAVQNVTVESFEALGHAAISVEVSWDPPADANGVLDTFHVCLGLMPLENSTEQAVSCRHGVNVTVRWR